MLKQVLFCCLVASRAMGAEIVVTLPCEERQVIGAGEGVVGELTVGLLDAAGVNYVGNMMYMKSIGQSPVGLDAMVVVSDRHMRAYGWCFSVDGVVPMDYASDVEVGESERVEWFFGYAEQIEGQWQNMCKRMLKKDQEELCRNK